MNKPFFAFILFLLMTVFYIFFFKKNIKNHSYKTLNHTVKHLALIMDGNRRWARRHGFKPWIGHKKGVESLKACVEFCLEHKISYLSVYAFSLENFKRSPEKLSYLFDILAQELASTELENLFKQDVKVCFIGDRSLFPQQLLSTIIHVEEKTASRSKLILNILFCYGGQQEIFDAVKKTISLVQKQHISPEDLSQKLFEKQFWTSSTPFPDLIIRTGGSRRLSNFFLYQAAYSELYFLDCYWPDLTKKDLYDCIQKFSATQRNFGE